MTEPLHIGVLGAGAIGCYLGGRLLAGGAHVTLLGRGSLQAEVAAHGLTITDLHGAHMELPAEQVRYETDPAALAECQVVLLTVKSKDTADAATVLRGVLPAGRAVVSMQNGVRNPEVLRAALPEHTIVPGMVPFNVLRKPNACFHQGTGLPLVLADSAPPKLVAALRMGGLPPVLHGDLQGVLWGKLLLNLNNAVNALSGRPLLEQLADRRYRRIMARVINEALTVLRAAKIKPRGVGRMQPTLAARILPLPDWLFRRAAAAMLKIDPQARSSMWEDLERRRAPEIDYLNGEIVTLAEHHTIDAPLNRALVAEIRAAAASNAGSPNLDAPSLLALLAPG
ncbi:2-dehydropantoate 2-reductase [Planctomycetota bacterium]|nr:2-dehydropantoate 2-reductase [Planctomycetota bacterium]